MLFSSGVSGTRLSLVLLMSLSFARFSRSRPSLFGEPTRRDRRSQGENSASVPVLRLSPRLPLKHGLLLFQLFLLLPILLLLALRSYKMLPYQQNASGPPSWTSSAVSSAVSSAPLFSSSPASPPQVPSASSTVASLPVSFHGPTVVLSSSRRPALFSVPSLPLQHFLRASMQRLAAPSLSGPPARWRDEGRVSPEKTLQVQLLMQQFRDGQLNDEQLKARLAIILGRDLFQLLSDEFLAMYASQLTPIPSPSPSPPSAPFPVAQRSPHSSSSLPPSSSSSSSPALPPPSSSSSSSPALPPPSSSSSSSPSLPPPSSSSSSSPALPPPPSSSSSVAGTGLTPPSSAESAASGQPLQGREEGGCASLVSSSPSQLTTHAVGGPGCDAEKKREGQETDARESRGSCQEERGTPTKTSDREGRRASEMKTGSPSPSQSTPPKTGSASPFPLEPGMYALSPAPSTGSSVVTVSPVKSGKTKKEGTSRRGAKASAVPNLVPGVRLAVSAGDEGKAELLGLQGVSPPTEGRFPPHTGPGLALSRPPFSSASGPGGGLAGQSGLSPGTNRTGAETAVGIVGLGGRLGPLAAPPVCTLPRGGLGGARGQVGSAAPLSSEYRENMSPSWWVGAALGSDAWRQMASSAEVIELVEKKKLTEQFRTLEGLVDRADFLGSLRLQGDGRSVLHFLGLSMQDFQQTLWSPSFPPILPPRLPTPAPPSSTNHDAAAAARCEASRLEEPESLSSSSAFAGESYEAKAASSSFRFPPQLVWERLRLLHPPLFSSLSAVGERAADSSSSLPCTGGDSQSLGDEEYQRLLPSFSLLAAIAQELESDGTLSQAGTSFSEGSAPFRSRSFLEEPRQPGETREEKETKGWLKKPQKGEATPDVKGEGSAGEETTCREKGTASSAADTAAGSASRGEGADASFASFDPYFGRSRFDRFGHSQNVCVGLSAMDEGAEGKEDFSFAPLLVDRDAVANLAQVAHAALNSILASALSVARRREAEERKAQEKTTDEADAGEQTLQEGAEEKTKVDRGEEAPEEDEEAADACRRRGRGDGSRGRVDEGSSDDETKEEEKRKAQRENEFGDRSSEEEDEGGEKKESDEPVAFARAGLGKCRPRHLWKPEGAPESEKEDEKCGGETEAKTDSWCAEAKDTQDASRSPNAEPDATHARADASSSESVGDGERAEKKKKTRITVSDILRALELHGGSIGSLLKAAEQRKRRREEEEVIHCLRAGTTRQKVQ
ncbi:hypothetical protein TGDOM2_265240 [Toxoplasma gondii GAB2-2007-GAL-DOM2]|uniref:Transmembrane protein n=4 Tax=Toxoplasma gondii TaxID=5811 RepID=S7UI10_TOXGG|nr:hypothetical protein TGGT1_265240 [Toxoplasma gondii GT1]KAF4644231.1 hypothetical protein TGRH88_012230 [Toxoplasma gondii]KFG38570.1 hypothetical protein TGDOM2_265240 [Toxoplasma gondii GAB2-2007-GAL-DOM2]RQX74002.1 hypothetical protein TGCAST_265240 [Toxoplasma gondii CAST]